MYISKNLVYLQMQKTGCSHVTTILRKYNRGRVNEKHEQMTDYDKFKDRQIVCSVRNPWDWYVSLWAFGCSGRGGLRQYLLALPQSELSHAVSDRSFTRTLQSLVRLLSRIGRRPDWKALYSDPGNEANFRTWLKLILGSEGSFIAKEGYASSAVKSVAGLMTYRFLALTTEYREWNDAGRAVRSYEELVGFADRCGITTRILRMETLDDDLFRLLCDMGKKVTLSDLTGMHKTNTSEHRSYADYYDNEARDLVARRDRFIIDRFGYSFSGDNQARSASSM